MAVAPQRATACGTRAADRAARAGAPAHGAAGDQPRGRDRGRLRAGAPGGRGRACTVVAAVLHRRHRAHGGAAARARAPGRGGVCERRPMPPCLCRAGSGQACEVRPRVLAPCSAGAESARLLPLWRSAGVSPTSPTVTSMAVQPRAADERVRAEGKYRVWAPAGAAHARAAPDGQPHGLPRQGAPGHGGRHAHRPPAHALPRRAHLRPPARCALAARR